LVSDIASFARFAEPVALDRLRENYGGRAFMLDGRFERRVDLLRIVAAAIELANLLVGEMLHHLQELGIPVFYGYSRGLESCVQVYWDTGRHADFREFVEAGRRGGARLMVFAQQGFALDDIDEALDQLEDSKLTRDEKHAFETRLRELQPFEGFTGALELSFDLEGRVYVFELRTEWYQSLKDTLLELEASTEEEDTEDQGPIPGYFSRN